MTSLSSQFHATREELADFVERWMAAQCVHAVAVEYVPFLTRSVTKENVRMTMMQPKVERIVFTEGTPNCTAASNGQLLDMNPGALVLNIGRLLPACLEECMLSTMNATPAWKAIMKDFKHHTKAGADFVHEETGGSGRDRNHRYTPGAKALSAKGIAMRQYAQLPTIFRFGE